MRITTLLIVIVSALITVSPRDTLAGKLVKDLVRVGVLEGKVKDGCGNPIGLEGTQHGCDFQPYPDEASEYCGYSGVGDRIDFVYGVAGVSESSVATDLGVAAELVIEAESGQQVWRQPVTPTYGSPMEYGVYSWELASNGGKVDVDRRGANFFATFELRSNSSGAGVSQKTLPLKFFIDDCEERQEIIRGLQGEAGVFQDPAFSKYLALEDAVATRICDRLSRSFLDYSSFSDPKEEGFHQRCKYQCVNNHFTNRLVDLARNPGDSVLRRAHDIVELKRLDPAGDYGSYNVVNDTLLMLHYVDMEDHLRAEGYIKCGGALNSADSAQSVEIIVDAFSEVVAGSTAYSGFVSMFGESEVRRHLRRTERFFEMGKEQE
ncbi:hypothetical protein [Arhodomonas sp. AD133]|uniref:hypothetical protein n=1 Tax=Arhodomonas sp. AD133 TaxID=3415009 RepID=UPI003EBA6ACF